VPGDGLLGVMVPPPDDGDLAPDIHQPDSIHSLYMDV
jgi:hypothetical protein